MLKVRLRKYTMLAVRVNSSSILTCDCRALEEEDEDQ